MVLQARLDQQVPPATSEHRALKDLEVQEDRLVQVDHLVCLDLMVCKVHLAVVTAHDKLQNLPYYVCVKLCSR